jgi:RNA polymerase sigma factor (sigma-70 family)
LYGIAANLLRHQWRSERRMLRAYARTGSDPVLLDEDSALARIDAASRHRELAQALTELRSQDREILLLHAWAELSDGEIAEALNLPIGTVKSRLHRTRARLGNRLAPSGQEQTKALLSAPEE